MGPAGFVHEPWVGGVLYRHTGTGAIPYTMDVHKKDTSAHRWQPGYHLLVVWPIINELAEEAGWILALHDMERRWFRLRQGNALLEWADQLYRTDEPASIQRARELYKAVLFAHGSKPDISPQWGRSYIQEIDIIDIVPGPNFGNGVPNPAVVAQRAHAKCAILQIDAGLNYYGADDTLVPSLRYRTLKAAADRLATAAEGASSDLLAYLGNIENAVIEQMRQANVIKKATLQGAIAEEQVGIAEHEVGLAQRQVNAVKAEIAKKKQELDDELSWFEWTKDFIVGMKDAVTSLTKSSSDLGGSGSYEAAKGALVSGSGAGIMGGMALFVYAGVTSLETINDQRTSLEVKISQLEDEALPAAKAKVVALERQVTIANLQRQIAEAEGQHAADLIHFAQIRFLNVEFWAELAALARRILRRYLTLGGRFGWLAERALSFEQDRPLDIVRLDYLPIKYQGITGASLLQSDLAELEAARLGGLRQSVPIRRTWSLAFDFPVKFAELKATGRCTFHTTDLEIRQAHPGTYGHRIEAVRVRPQNLKGVSPYQGLLRNTGVSTLSRADGSSHLAVRFEDTLPLCQAGPDGTIATPHADETLGLFEGVGIDTTWVLELPALANPYGLSGLTDILLTVDMRARFSAELHDAQEANPPTGNDAFVVISAATYAPAAITALRDPATGTVDVTFDVTKVPLPISENNRKTTNAFLFVAAAGDTQGSVTVSVANPATTITVPLQNGVAVSNAGPLSGGQPAQPLNALVGKPTTQSHTVTINKAMLTGIDYATVEDVVLGLQYEATV